MSKWRDHEPVTDADLVTYLDGLLGEEDAGWLEREAKLDPALDARLDLLRRGDRPFAQAYDFLLHEAPEKRLNQILKLAKEPPPPPVAEPEPPEQPEPDAARGAWSGWRLLAAAAALPGIPRVRVGSIEPPMLALLATSAQMIAS